MAKKYNLFEKIASKPSKNSTIWRGGKRSILSTILLWFIWICRLFSLLQIFKLVYRELMTFFHKDVYDEKSKRPNVPPFFTEIYFVLWLGVLLLFYFMKWSNLAVHIAIYYYLFESIVWISYYTIFRRFFEENYALYHALENLTILALVIPCQALSFASLHDLTFLSSLLGLLGAGGDGTLLQLKLCGTFNAAIVIGLIISNFPTESKKSESENEEIMIIGNGEVVQKRLLPALKRANYEDYRINIFNLSKDKNEKHIYNSSEQKKLFAHVASSLNFRSVIWIETPPNNHIEYMREYADNKFNLMVIEKPISSKIEDLKYVEDLIENTKRRDKYFFLSYYLLEKALPLTYMVGRNERYRKYLNVENESFADYALKNLGKLISAEVEIIEGEDKRMWAFDDKENGGQLIETFVHNVLICSLFAGLPKYWSDVNLNIDDRNQTISLEAQSGMANITLKQVKNQKDSASINRHAVFTFENGFIKADFDKENAVISLNSVEQESIIGVKKFYSNKYDVQVDLVKRVAQKECHSSEVDGLANQIEVLTWLIQQKEEPTRH